MQSSINKILIELQTELKYKLKSYSDGWIHNLKFKNKEIYIYGYQFPLDNGTTRMLCDDKAAQCDIFNYKKVPCFQHRYFYKIPFDFSIIKKYLKQYKEIVIKKNNGTGGQGIFRTTKFNEVKKIIEQLNYHFSLSPFYEYKNEYRVILLNGKPMLCYCKKRPFIISDGKTKLKDILESKKINLDDVKPGLNLNKVYKNGEEIEVSWKHNLGLGATPTPIKDKKLLKKLVKLAQSAAKAINNAKFCSIDIAEFKNKFLVVEINGGVMMEKFAQFSKQCYEKAKNIYKQALISALYI